VKLSLNPDWRFVRQDVPDAKNAAFDDSKWSLVSCPHTYNDIDTFDDFSPGSHVGELNQWQGRTWYRKHFTPDASWANRKVFVEFEGVRQIAEVYLNGELLGVAKSGFTPFGFDLTPHLRFGKDNVLAVMTDNRFVSHGKIWQRANITEGLPWNDPHWHPAHGGIYRNVYLHVTDKVHVTLPLYSNLGTEGTYVFANNVAGESADVSVEAEVQNETDAPKAVDCTFDVLDSAGHSVLKLNDRETLAAGAKQKLNATGKLAKPLLWEPAHPYLYTVVTTLSIDGKPVDRYETPLGIRTCTWSVKDGFSINGHHLKLHGYGQKPTDEWPGLGAAQPDWLHEYTLQLMKDGSTNFVRWGHCAGGPSLIRSADRLGIITYQPGVDGEGDCTGEAWKVRAAAFRDVLVYFRNNPSILIWEGGNQSVSADHLKQLLAYRHEFDPNGGRAYTHRRANATVCPYIDIAAGTEGGHECPDKAVVEVEYDREESPRRVWDNFSPPTFGYPEGKGQLWNLTSEDFALNQAMHYMQKIADPSHCGGAKWIFSDTTSGGRITSEVTRASGVVDGARLPKEAYYATQAIFSDPAAEPRVHIVGHWNYPAGTTKTVDVISNCDEVELLVNGKSLGKGQPSWKYNFAFPAVTFAPGTIEAVGYKSGKPVARDTKKTAGPAKRLKLTPITGPGGLRADGSDVVLIDVEAVDADGNRCPTWTGRVDFTPAGAGIWRGGYNSGKAGSTNNTWLDLECGINRVSVRSTLTPGTIRVEARAEGLEPGHAEIVSHPVEIRNGLSTELPEQRKPEAQLLRTSGER
jgi:beta-galactosidase